MSNARRVELDGLRGLAILLVLLHHIIERVHVEPGTYLAYALVSCRLFWGGVDLFFVLSGFLIGGILLDNRDSSSFYGTFYVRRSFRILPLYFCFLGLAAIYLYFLPTDMRGVPLWSYFVYLQNFYMARTLDFGIVTLGITWSLAVEEQFYALCPIAVRYFSRIGLAILCIALLVLALLLRVYMGPSLERAIFVLPMTRLDGLMFGVLCAILVRNSWYQSCERITRLICLRSLFVIGAIALVLATIGTTPRFHFFNFGPFLYLLLAGTSAVILLLCIECVYFKHVFRLRILVRLGTLAYGIYLFHMVFLYALPSQWAMLAALLSIGTAAASWWLFECRFVNYGHRWKYNV